MTTQEIANKLINMCRQGQWGEAQQELYHAEIQSIEPEGAMTPNTSGFEAKMQKFQHWAESVQEWHGVDISDPLVAGNHFSCRMNMDLTFKEGGRTTIDELCVYEVKDGKIAKETFFYPVSA